MEREETKFALEVDRLGAEGLDQDQIAERLGTTKYQLRYRLLQSGFRWGVETRVRVALTDERLEDLARREEVAA